MNVSVIMLGKLFFRLVKYKIVLKPTERKVFIMEITTSRSVHTTH